MITNPSTDQLTCGFLKNKNKTAGKTHHPLFTKYKYNYEEHYEAFFIDDNLHVIVLPHETFPVTFFFTE